MEKEDWIYWPFDWIIVAADTLRKIVTVMIVWGRGISCSIFCESVLILIFLYHLDCADSFFWVFGLRLDGIIWTLCSELFISLSLCHGTWIFKTALAQGKKVWKRMKRAPDELVLFSVFFYFWFFQKTSRLSNY